MHRSCKLTQKTGGTFLSPPMASGYGGGTAATRLRKRLKVIQHMDGSKNRGKPPNHHILIGFSIIFTIHFGGFPPIFGSTPILDDDKQ